MLSGPVRVHKVFSILPVRISCRICTVYTVVHLSVIQISVALFENLVYCAYMHIFVESNTGRGEWERYFYVLCGINLLRELSIRLDCY